MALSFLSPWFLVALSLIPTLGAAYVWWIRKPSRSPLPYPNATVLAAAAQHSGFRSHIPAVLFLLALAAIIVSVARPVTSLPVRAHRATLILTLDVSSSMQAKDIVPTRLDAARAAAKSFMKGLPEGLRLGLVTFSSTGNLIVPPTSDHVRVVKAIDTLHVGDETAMGDGLAQAVASLPDRAGPDGDGGLPYANPFSLPTGIVILLSDGLNNAGMDPMKAAELARRQQVVVYTVGVAAPTPADMPRSSTALDDETLDAMARLTGGLYFHASSAEGLREVYQEIRKSLGWQPQPVEVSALTAGLSTAALLAALVLSRLRGVYV
jgi:Ca-activated chloride channel family protein